MQAEVIALSATLITDQLREKLVAAIIFGDLPADARLVEDSIAEQYGISRSPVREALRRIEADGLLIREGAKGLKVAPLTRSDLDQVYTCRLPLEGIAAAEAAARRSGRDLAALDEIYRRLVAAQQAAAARDYFLGNVAFTDAVHAATGNVTLCRLLGGLSKQAQRYRYAAYQMFPHLMSLSVEGTCQIIGAIAARDTAAARRLTEELIQRSWTILRDCFDV